MEKTTIENTQVEINKTFVKNFLNRITYPIAIIDFETFRTLNSKHQFFLPAQNEFLEKVFSVSSLIFLSKEELAANSLLKQKPRLFTKTLLPKVKDFPDFDSLLTYQNLFFKFFISKLLKYNVKSLIFLGSRTEVVLLKNYLTYFFDNPKYKAKISSFFHQKTIFDLYDLWNRDEVVNLPQYKVKKGNQVGANKKTTSLIKSSEDYLKVLQKTNKKVANDIISNNDIGRIIDQYFINNCTLLPSFLPLVRQHNEYDVLVGATVLSFLYNIIERLGS